MRRSGFLVAPSFLHSKSHGGRGKSTPGGLEDLHRLAMTCHTEIEANPLGHPRAALKLRVTGASQVGCLGLTGAGCTSWAGKGVNMPQDGGGRWVRWAWGSNMI